MIIIDDDGVMHKVYTKTDMVDMLDKIRAEIKELQTYFREMVILDEVMQILDKYKAESEGK